LILIKKSTTASYLIKLLTFIFLLFQKHILNKQKRAQNKYFKHSGSACEAIEVTE